MALDERDYHSYRLSEEEKERRLQEIRNRFDAETKKNEIVLKQRVRTNTGNYYVPKAPFILFAIAGVYVGAYLLTSHFKNAVSDRPVITIPYPRQASEPGQPESSLKRDNRERPASATNQPRPQITNPASNRDTRLAAIKESHWKEVYSPAPECRQARTALKDLECRNQAEGARQQFERQWANKLASGWIPRELK